MCGIAGFIGHSNVEDHAIESCLESLGHRGPDAKGFISFNASNKNITLLHTRLSILDLDERSNQPFQYKDSIIVFNGEIYNFIELRSLRHLNFGEKMHIPSLRECGPLRILTKRINS